MQLKTRVLIIIAASLTGLVAMGFFGLYTMRQSMMQERYAQIGQLMDFAKSQMQYFHEQEKAGTMSLEEAQTRAKEAISAQKAKGNYFIVRALADNMLLVHATASRVGKIDPGGKATDGRPVLDVYKEEIRNSKDGNGFVMLNAVRPNSGDERLYKKLNGATIFEPWNWMIAIGFFVDDIDTRFWQQSAIFLAVGSVLLGLMAALVFRMRSVILRQLGGEPQDAAESMKKIANGDLGVEIRLEKDDSTSLMASLKLMQMKLTNLTSAIQDNAITLADQVLTFDGVAKSYAESKSEEDLSNLHRSVKRLGKTADILKKSIARFKL
jgi:methyl-accepting chemotaxis protein